MSAQNRTPSALMQWLRPLLIGTAVGIIVCIALLLLMAAVVQAVDVPQRATIPLAVTAAAAGAFFAGLAAARAAGQRGLLFGALCGLLLFLLILLAGFIRYTGVSGGYAMVKLAVLLTAGGLGGVLGVNRQGRRKRH